MSCKTKTIWVWNQKCFIWVLLGQIFKNLLSYLKSAPPNLSKYKLYDKVKKFKFGTKFAIFGYLWIEIWKSYCHCMFLSCPVRVSEWIHTIQLPACQGTPCSKQVRNMKFKSLKLLSYLKPGASNLSKCKVSC